MVAAATAGSGRRRYWEQVNETVLSLATRSMSPVVGS
jgi:hypothetical protein